jgi:hypothetical protein
MGDYGHLAARIRDVAPAQALRLYGQQVTPDGAERYDLYLLDLAAPCGRPARGRRANVLLNGGTHGDEPAGAEAVVRFLEERRYAAWPEVRFTVAPCTNPWGYVHGRREGPGGIDLNRSFRRATRAVPEVARVKRALRGRAFDLFVDCHEDVDAPGFYVFAPRPLGSAIVAAARAHGPVHPGPWVDGTIPVEDGVVALRPEAPTGAGPLPAGSWAASLPPPDVGQLATATVETPVGLPLEQRVQMHLAAVDAALRAVIAAR